jgi:hypothetical protein
MRKVAAVFSLAAVLMLSSVTGAMAISIVTDTTWSWACNAVCAGSDTTSTAVSAQPGPWATETTGTWISHVDSGVGDFSVLPNTIVTFSKVVDFGAGGSLLTLNVWADDTAGVFIDGLPLLTVGGGLAPNPLLDDICAAGKLGCEQDEFGSFSEFRSGVHTLSIQVSQLFQGEATPFGALAEGDLAAVPEPATILLLGSALAAAGVASRRRLAKKSEAASSEAAS